MEEDGTNTSVASTFGCLALMVLVGLVVLSVLALVNFPPILF